MRSILPDIRHSLEARYQFDVLTVERVWSGTTGVHARADTTTGPLFVKTYPLRGDDQYALLNISVQRQWRAAGIPTIAPIASPDGTLLYRRPGLVMSVWEWSDAEPVRPLSHAHAPAVGQTLARLHRCLDRMPIAGLPFNPEPARNAARPSLVSRFETLDQFLASQVRPDGTALRAQLRHRIRLLEQVPHLRAGLSRLRLDRVHGDLTAPNLLWTGTKLTAVIDPQIQVADRARELGRIAFDPGSVAESAQWQHIGLATVAAYIEAGGPLAPAEILSCARLALLHSLASTYPLGDMIYHELPARVHEQHRRYWQQRCTSVERMLDALPDLENQLRDLTSATLPAGAR
ncbi:phosphotransferase [Hamadaea sp. NPDC050747]|uniref:phosphotransferase enzyme family protein n=1 Tax=Hamadaea sp. NPDC050747 TaxID=3155789 RepID=UPI0033D31506